MLRKICSYAQAGGRSEPLDKKRNDILNIKKEKLPSFDTIRAELSRIRRSDKFLIRKTGIGQLASLPDKSETICLSAADTYWTAFMLHNHRSISQYEKSLDNFISSQHNYPADIIEFLKDLISVEHSFESNLPDALVTPKNPDKIFSGKLEEYKSCDFLLNYIKLEQTFCLQYYIDILVLLHDKNPELCSSVQVLNPGEKIRKYTDTKTPCIRQLEELPETYFIKLCSYLNDMPNVFSRTLFLSYAFDCYYTLEHSEHNYTSEPAIQTSIHNYEQNVYASDFNNLTSWSRLILFFLIYINKELLPVLTELWQAASDYLNLYLSGNPEECGDFSNILISYASAHKDDLVLDFASLSVQALNNLAAEFKHETYGSSPDSPAAWQYFQNTMIPKIRNLTRHNDISDDLSDLTRLKKTIITYNHRKNIFSKNDLQKIEHLIIKTKKQIFMGSLYLTAITVLFLTCRV